MSRLAFFLAVRPQAPGDRICAVAITSLSTTDPPKVRLIEMLEKCGGFLYALAHAEFPEHSPCVVQRAMQDLLDCTDALGVQALLGLHRTNMRERITDKLLLLRRHQPSIQCFGISPPALSPFVPSQALPEAQIAADVPR